MKNYNLLIGAVSGNYSKTDIVNWVNTSKWKNCDRVLLLYNDSKNDLESYLKSENIFVIKPYFDFWGNNKQQFNYDTGKCDVFSSYDLIHNARFFHIWNFLQSYDYSKVLITDVKDIYFNRDPFEFLNEDKITATSEEIIYNEESWNKEHVFYNLGIIGLNLLLNKPVYNVGVLGGGKDLVKEMCQDIYLMSVGKQKVADQTSFNYLIQTKYKSQTNFSGISDNFAVHLHVINSGLVKFNIQEVNKYCIVHQYDRIKGFKFIYHDLFNNNII